MLDWGWYNDIPVRILFLHMLLLANEDDCEWLGNKIPAGGFITSIANLSKSAGITPQQTRTALDKLKSTNEITIKTSTQFTLIQLNNWQKYQVNNKADNKRATNEQQTSNNSIKNIRNKNTRHNEIESSFNELIAQSKTMTSDDPTWGDVVPRLLKQGYKPFIAGDVAGFFDGEWKVKGAQGWVPSSLSVREHLEFRKTVIRA